MTQLLPIRFQEHLQVNFDGHVDPPSYTPLEFWCFCSCKPHFTFCCQKLPAYLFTIMFCLAYTLCLNCHFGLWTFRCVSTANDRCRSGRTCQHFMLMIWQFVPIIFSLMLSFETQFTLRSQQFYLFVSDIVVYPVFFIFLMRVWFNRLMF